MLDCSDNCIMLPRITALEEANKQHSETHREIFKRLNTIERESGEQAVMLKNIDEKLDKLIEWQNEQRERIAKIDNLPVLEAKVRELETKPAKRWDNMVEKVIWTVATAVVAFLLGRLGL